ncbi:PilZ domain-containing protein [Methylobacterium sp. NEAU 140]|uniref:PilZ domain-containing protein n=1 Tax=Methylobacterium sp. NEAU 140 TaxID=3064945 RepID=UPI0027347CFE|nr:PilZ domain-containing protein [Methylobacterium sp. NEAU 140]MDP4025340.1 PilZ domain-containing protein [Methylobacterium sp. NEAU 140]
MSSDNRREPRQRVFLKGRITFNNGASSFDCLVRDLSGLGARLALSETASLPEAFDLYIAQKDRTYRSMLRWRRQDGIGVTFVEAAQPAAQPAAEPAGGDASVAFLLRRIGELEAENAALRRMLAGTTGPGVAGPGDAASAA